MIWVTDVLVPISALAAVAAIFCLAGWIDLPGR